jgi:signal transduction histidine kinase
MWDGLIFDVTDQKRVEEQRNQLENQLRHAQRIEALGTFAGGIAHDINNTLVPIVALGRMTLNSMPANSEHRDSLKTILDAAYRVRDLVAEILAFSRKEMPKTERVSLSETITKAVRLISAMVAPNVNIVQRIDSSCVIDADANQLVQVLMNLCTNAAHAIGRNNGQITIGLDEVVIADTAGSDGTSLPPGAYARLTVADNGSGMDAVTRQRIFEPFFTTKTVGEGTGLGLSVAHGIIANHRGRIAVDSELGRGTTFTIHLPLAGSDEIDTPAPPLKRAS